MVRAGISELPTRQETIQARIAVIVTISELPTRQETCLRGRGRLRACF